MAAIIEKYICIISVDRLVTVDNYHIVGVKVHLLFLYYCFYQSSNKTTIMKKHDTLFQYESVLRHEFPCYKD